MADTPALRSVVLCGHSKCGTRWLNLIVASNPHVVVINMKDIVPDNERRLRELVQKSLKIVYFDIPFAIQNIETLALLKRIDPDMGAINIYREPIDAMLSMHNYSRAAYGKGSLGGPDGTVSFEEFVADRDFVSSFENGQLHNVYQAVFRYDKNAMNLRQHFQIWKEFLYDDIRMSRNSFLKELFTFMQVPNDWQCPGHPVNKSLAYRSNLLHRLIMKSVYLLTGVDTSIFRSAFARGQMHPSLLYILMNMNSKNPHFLTNEQIKRLRKVTSPMVTEFKQITKLDLKCWGY